MFKSSLVLLATLSTAPCFAAYQNSADVGMGGFSGPSQAPVTVSEVKKYSVMQDDTPVVLIGRITGAIGGEHYAFKDSTGEITVEIDHEDWRGVNVSPQNKVKIYGEVDKDFAQNPKIDVKRVEIIQ
ncbi:MAG: NirD/YgiW/YdeI family stress tolerance protein [Plesiomonas shigelloides]